MQCTGVHRAGTCRNQGAQCIGVHSDQSAWCIGVHKDGDAGLGCMVYWGARGWGMQELGCMGSRMCGVLGCKRMGMHGDEGPWCISMTSDWGAQ